MNVLEILLLVFCVLVTLTIICGLIGVFDKRYFPPPKDTTSTPRYYVNYRSPRFGTCVRGGCCDICDGRRKSLKSYTLDEARAIQRDIAARDAMALTYLEREIL